MFKDYNVWQGKCNDKMVSNQKIDLMKLRDLKEIIFLRGFGRSLEYAYNILSSRTQGLVIKDKENKIVGFGWIKFTGAYDKFVSLKSENIALISSIYIEESQRGKGLGRLLLNELIREACSKNKKEIYSLVNISNDASNNLFNNMQFKLHSKVEIIRVFKFTVNKARL